MWGRRRREAEEEMVRTLREFRELLALARQFGMAYLLHGGSRGGSDWGAIFKGLLDAGKSDED